jgi:hypothetical protein
MSDVSKRGRPLLLRNVDRVKTWCIAAHRVYTSRSHVWHSGFAAQPQLCQFCFVIACAGIAWRLARRQIRWNVPWQAIILSREPRFRAMETPMPRRASSFSPILPGVVCVLLAAAAPGLVSSAQAECITQPNQQAPDGAHWSLHFDPVKNRRCWVLVDSASGDPPAPEPQPAAPSGLSSLQSFLSNITGSPSAQPPEAPASPTAAPPRKLQPRVARPSVANVNGTDHPVRTEQKADAQPARHEMTRGERDALFEEFLRWRESKKVTGPANPR